MAKKKTEEKTTQKKTKKPPKRILEKKYRESTEENTSETVDNIFALSEGSKESGHSSRKLDSGIEEDNKMFDPNGFVDDTSKGAPVDWWEQIPNESDLDDADESFPALADSNLSDDIEKLRKTIEELQNAYSVLKTRFDEKCAEYDSLARAYVELKNQQTASAQRQTVSDQRRAEMVRQSILRQKYEDQALRGNSWN